ARLKTYGALFGDKNHKAFSRFCLCGHEKSGLATWPSGLPSPFAPLRFPGQSARGLAASDFLVYCLDKSLAPEIRQ
ncbi:hypothetical protein, partial [Pseudomonas aeruginosa]|uniref:hypothetical protein n=1 Tax=Pseudomonas aeruginosa TaxID=287 RepID=UPI001E58044B